MILTADRKYPITSNIKGEGDICMKGGIYTDQHCPICGGTFKDDHVRSLYCPAHPHIHASRLTVRFVGVVRRFKSYDAASRFLTGVRFKIDEKEFDRRDYQKDHPLGFENQITKWLKLKEEKVKPGSFKNLKGYVYRSIEYFHNTSVKEIDFEHLEDFITTQKVSNKTRHNIVSALHDFWSWMKKRHVLRSEQIPEFPVIKFNLGYRKTIDKNTQNDILDEIKRISYEFNPRIWLGIKWLCTYVSVRPGEMIRMKEGDIDIGNGYFLFPDPKEKRYKMVPLIDDDVEILKSLPSGLPALPFFRHLSSIQGVKVGEPFGKKYFYKWWIKACQNLKIDGVDLYGGTRHSSVKALRKHRTPEEIRRATMHSTNKAFERYFQIESDDVRNVYSDSAPGKKLVKNFYQPNKVKSP